jgi:LmbE family N-acetylglucosaminyl deacetylase
MTGMDEAAAFRGKQLVAVFAHPDDESLAAGGLLSWCAALGARVTLLCATRGENGGRHSQRAEGADGPEGPETREARDTLGVRREHELHAAARALGAHDVLLLRHEDGMLPWVDPSALEAEIVATIRGRRADVVVTFDTDGLYWHPDHIAIHERTTSALRTISRVGSESRGYEPDTPHDIAESADPALYYVTMPPAAMRDVVDYASHGPAGPDTTPHILGVRDPDAFGAEAPSPTLIVDTGQYAVQKLRALHCHRSQMRGCALEALSEQDAPRFLGLEHYRRAPIGGPALPFIEHLRRPSDAVTRVERA